jgi:Ni/Fe-hydrogenase subunit HybB-like protein
MNGVEGYMYPNEYALQWSILIVLYPFITGLVAGAFILASLERVFRVEAVKPTYRLALLTALAFLLVAPLPLVLHLGHPRFARRRCTSRPTTPRPWRCSGTCTCGT